MDARFATTKTGSRYLVLAVALACLPALAEDVAFDGHTLEVEVGQDTRTITRIVGTRYQINAATAQIIDKARACLANQDGVTVEPGEAGSNEMIANSRVNYRAGWGTRSARSRIAIEASDGYFRIVQSGLGVAEASVASAGDADYRALQHAGGWNNPVSAMIAVDQAVIDCLYR